MSRFSTEGLPRPVVFQPLDYEAARLRRLMQFVDIMREFGIEYDVETMETDPGTIGARSAAWGDLHFIAALNDWARVILLPSFAEGTDLDIQAMKTGLERFEGETDAALRERMRLAWKGKSAAGSDDYYKSAARNFSLRVKDVELDRETRNFSERVLILSVLTSDNGGLLSEDLQEGLSEALNDAAFRPHTVSLVEVVPAVITTRSISAKLYLYPETPDAVAEQAREALIAAHATDQRLGFDLTRSYVEKHLHRSGVQRVELPGFSNTYAAFNEAVRLGTVTVTTERLSS